MDWKRQLLRNAQDPYVACKVTAALDQLLERDRYLLEQCVDERAITHRIAVYLEQLFQGWDVDCEFNRDGHEIKRGSDGNVRPDIIVHHRGTDENLLVIEVKKSTNSASAHHDLQKLQDFKTQLQYRNALFVVLECGAGTASIQAVQWVD